MKRELYFKRVGHRMNQTFYVTQCRLGQQLVVVVQWVCAAHITSVQIWQMEQYAE